MLGKIFLIFIGYIFIRMVLFYFKARKAFNEVMRNAAEQRKPLRKEGEVTISFKENKGRLKDDGQYTDYEEVKD